MTASTANEDSVDLDDLPGHHIRRLHQIAVAIFLQETEPLGLTPVQYAALQGVANAPGVDQRTLARTIGLDTSTTGGVVDRLEARGLLQRNAHPDDRRVRRLTLTGAGQALLHPRAAAGGRARRIHAHAAHGGGREQRAQPRPERDLSRQPAAAGADAGRPAPPDPACRLCGTLRP